MTAHTLTTLEALEARYAEPGAASLAKEVDNRQKGEASTKAR